MIYFNRDDSVKLWESVVDGQHFNKSVISPDVQYVTGFYPKASSFGTDVIFSNRNPVLDCIYRTGTERVHHDNQLCSDYL